MDIILDIWFIYVCVCIYMYTYSLKYLGHEELLDTTSDFGVHRNVSG